MKLQTFDIPDDPAMLPAWLDQHLLGLHLHQLVTELTILGGHDEEPSVPLRELLGEQIRGVLQTGLRSLSREQLRLLMKKPRSLLELQRMVLDEGGDYWTTVPASAEMQANTSETWQKVERAIHANETKAVPSSLWTAVNKPWVWAGAGWLSAAAAIFFAVLVQQDRVRQLENRLAEQTAANDMLRKEMQTQQQAIAAVRFQPADLPESVEVLVQATLDPADLPPDVPDDPQDLPAT